MQVKLLYNMAIAGQQAPLAEGGALYINRGSSLVAHECELIGNIVSGGQSSTGGAICALTDSNVTIDASLLRDNKWN